LPSNCSLGSCWHIHFEEAWSETSVALCRCRTSFRNFTFMKYLVSFSASPRLPLSPLSCQLGHYLSRVIAVFLFSRVSSLFLQGFFDCVDMKIAHTLVISFPSISFSSFLHFPFLLSSFFIKFLSYFPFPFFFSFSFSFSFFFLSFQISNNNNNKSHGRSRSLWFPHPRSSSRSHYPA